MPFSDDLAFLDQYLQDLAGHVGADVDVFLGLDLAGGRDFFDQVPFLNFFHRDFKALAAAGTDIDQHDQRNDRHNGGHNDFFLVFHPCS